MTKCEQCGKSGLQNLGNHWNKSSKCAHPDPSTRQMDVLTGILLGDGSVCRDSGRPKIRVEMVNERYLKHVSDILGNLSTGVRMSKTADEAAEINRERGFRPDADGEDYQDVYCLQTRRLPAFRVFSSWYESGEKRYPEEMKLTPTSLRHWYVCDGHIAKNKDHHRPYVIIACNNEVDRKGAVKSMFRGVNISVQFTDYGHIRIGVDATEDFFDFIGHEPVPGFGGKWHQNV